MIPTAQEFLIKGKYKDRFGRLLMYAPEAQTALIEFAKLHVEEALKAASENAEVICDSSDIFQSIDKDSILNSYPLTVIILDSCEYYYKPGGNTALLTHKGNCKNHKTK
jgi:hypothetical protein